MHEGLVGLVAGKYTREYEQPAFVMHYNPKEEIYKGSARGIDGFNIYNFFTHHEDLFVQYGGHAKAGGFTITKSNYPLVYDALMNDIKDAILKPVSQLFLLHSLIQQFLMLSHLIYLLLLVKKTKHHYLF